MAKTTTSPLLWLPSAADGIQLTPSATAWADASWHELTASAPTDLYLAYLTVLPNDGAIVAEEMVEIDIGTGAASSEVVIATIRTNVLADQWWTMSTIPLGVLYRLVYSGTRVALRIRHSVASDTSVYRVAVGYFSSLGGATGWSVSAPTAAPLGSTTVSVAGTTAWANGAWSEVIASTATPIAITGIAPRGWSVVGEIQIGSGASGSETVKATIPYGNTGGVGNGLSHVRLPRPLCITTSGVRIAVRQRANTSDAFFITLWTVGI